MYVYDPHLISDILVKHKFVEQIDTGLPVPILPHSYNDCFIRTNI